MNSFISWVGGKKLLRKEIIKKFPKEEIEKYVEPFGGAAWVLFGKTPHSKEVYNDINGELVNLFRMVKYHPEALQAELSFMLNSREEFFRQRGMQPETMTELQRAARMFYLIKASYGSKVSTFGVGFKDVSAIKNLQAVHERLSKVLIENKSFDEILQIHDSERTLFFIDPPYHGTEKFYQMKDDFGETEHRRDQAFFTTLSGYPVHAQPRTGQPDIGSKGADKVHRRESPFPGPQLQRGERRQDRIHQSRPACDDRPLPDHQRRRESG